MTQKKIAAALGFSVATVSKAFADSDEISQETKQRIFDYARHAGCFEKHYTGHGGVRTIAVLCPEMKSTFYSSVLNCLSLAAERRGMQVVASMTDFRAEKQNAWISYYASCHRADGIILLGEYVGEKSPPLPLVQFSSRSNGHYTDSIAFHMRKGMDEAVKLFVQSGKTRIAMIGETLTKGKDTLFCRILKENRQNIDPAYMICTEERFEFSGYRGMERLMQLPKPPDAVFAAYDDIGIGALKYLAEHGIAVPEQVSVIGMNNIDASEFATVPLTTVDLHYDHACDVALELIERRLAGEQLPPQSIVLNSTLTVRQSAH